MDQTGVLFLCATPIGNLEDITLRVIRVLKEVDLVAAEDTRHTRKLFSHYDIHTPLTSYHDHNMRSRGKYLIEKLLSGLNIALVTDAGMPGLSDPGEELTAQAISSGIKVSPVPGASAAVAALVVSGFPAGRFCFEGFLPARGKARRLRLEGLRGENRTMIFYEAPHRIAATLSDLKNILGNRNICIARELTKHYEEIWRGNLGEALVRLGSEPLRGEMTIIVGGLVEQETVGEDRSVDKDDLLLMVLALEKEGFTWKEAVKETSRRLSLPKREVYNAVVGQKK